MGSYLNPGSTAFQGSLRSQIYIDKSGLIEKTNTVQTKTIRKVYGGKYAECVL